MVTFVVVLNTFISLILFYAAWRVWQIKQRLTNIADALTTAERNSHAVLSGAPNSFTQCQQNVGKIRFAYRSLDIQVRKLKQVFGLLVFGQQTWNRYSRRISLKN